MPVDGPLIPAPVQGTDTGDGPIMPSVSTTCPCYDSRAPPRFVERGGSPCPPLAPSTSGVALKRRQCFYCLCLRISLRHFDEDISFFYLCTTSAVNAAFCTHPTLAFIVSCKPSIK